VSGGGCRIALSGQYLLLLIMFKLIWPQANYCDDDARIFSEQDMGRALRKLGYTQKVTLTVAYQAFTQRNMDLSSSLLDSTLAGRDSRDSAARAD
jgi:hypothetical protein